MKTIHYPGDHGQRCQAHYAIGADRSERAGLFGRTVILFVADEKSIGGTFPSFADTPDYLVNKVLDQELAGCRLQFIDVFYASYPDERQRRDVYKWDFYANLHEPKGPDASRVAMKTYVSPLDQLKDFFNIPGARFDLEVRAEDPCAGIYPVVVRNDHQVLPEEERIELLNRFGVLSR